MTSRCRASAIAVVCLASIFGACSKEQAATTPDAALDAPAVAVVKTTPRDLSQAIVLTAEFRPYQEVDVMAKVAGYVSNISVDAGDRVRQGQLLATLEIPEMADDRARAQAAIDRSRAEVTRAKDDLRRAESSHRIAHLSHTRLADVLKQKPGLVAQQEVDEAQSKDLVAEAQVASATSNLAAAEQQVRVNDAELKKIDTMFDYTRVTAPFDGVITRRSADQGSMIQAGTAANAMPLVRVSQNSLLRLILPVPESAVPTVHIGQPVEVRVPVLKRSFPGRVARFADKVQLSTRTMDTEVDVPNPGLVLIPGMFAEVDLTLQQRRQVLTVPIPAIDLSGDESTGQVAMVTPGNRIELRQVRLGLQNASDVEIQSGLSDGDLVVIGNRASLRPGEQVRPKLEENTAQAAP